MEQVMGIVPADRQSWHSRGCDQIPCFQKWLRRESWPGDRVWPDQCNQTFSYC